MTTVLSRKGEIVLPGVIRRQLHLQPGDHFEVFAEGEATVTLRRVSHPANYGLVDLLLACPSTFEIGPRNRN
jgi:AbrB family looped-hinge helix DNA binding protein